MHEHDRTNLDSRIDAALRAYAEPPHIPDPRTIALRLLQQAREVEPRPKWPLWRWAIPLAACLVALAIAAGYLLRTPRAHEVAHTPAPPKVVALTKALPPTAQHASTPRKRRILAVKSRPLPRLSVFPTPTPLSPQEQALVAFAKYAPPAVQRAVIQEQKHWDDPITVAGLQKPQPQAANQQDQ